MFEDTADEKHVSEERLYTEIDGWVISGAIDVQKIENDGIVVMDYKTTSVWSVILGKSQWEYQLNCYAALVRRVKNVPVKGLKVIAILRDWRSKDAEEKPDYPRAPIVEVNIPLWEPEKQDAYLNGRVALHQKAEFDRLTGSELPWCSDDERWIKENKWALKRKGQKRAVKVFDNEPDAIAAVQDGMEVEFRRGEATRCKANWCRVSAWCSQYQAEQDSIESGY
jgi:hypothetical protein